MKRFSEIGSAVATPLPDIGSNLPSPASVTHGCLDSVPNGVPTQTSDRDYISPVPLREPRPRFLPRSTLGRTSVGVHPSPEYDFLVFHLVTRGRYRESFGTTPFRGDWNRYLRGRGLDGYSIFGLHVPCPERWLDVDPGFPLTLGVLYPVLCAE